MDVESNPGFFVSALFHYVIGLKILVPLSQQIRFKTEPNRDLVTRIFPRFEQFACFYPKLSLAIRDIFLTLIGCRDSFGFGLATFNRKAFFKNILILGIS